MEFAKLLLKDQPGYIACYWNAFFSLLATTLILHLNSSINLNPTTGYVLQ